MSICIQMYINIPISGYKYMVCTWNTVHKSCPSGSARFSRPAIAQLTFANFFFSVATRALRRSRTGLGDGICGNVKVFTTICGIASGKKMSKRIKRLHEMGMKKDFRN